MNKTNFVLTGGWPLNAERLEELETAYSIFNAFGALAGDLSIISGCVTVGSTVGNGFVYIAGELLAFKTGAVTPTSSVIIIEEPINRSFESSDIKTVHTIRYATFGTAETSWPWTHFDRPVETKTIPAWQTSVINRLNTIENKLNTIQQGAEVNVASNWNITDPLSDAFIFNKPVSEILYKGSFYVGDFSGAVSKQVTFPNLDTANYTVLGSMRTVNNLNNEQDPTQIWVVHGRTIGGFSLILREIGNFTQSLYFDYVIIKN